MGILEDGNKLAKRRFFVVIFISFTVIAFVAGLSYANFIYTKNNAINRVVYTELPWLSQKIEAQINSSLTAPIAVSKDMANDPWLRRWLVSGEKDIGAITEKLSSAKAAHNALSAFVVSDKSSKYYNEQGLHKTLDLSKDPHDVWFYDFKKYTSTNEYELTADTSQANKDRLSIFINYALRAEDKSFLAAVGFGLTVDDFGKKIQEFKSGRDDIQLWLTDEKGDIRLSESGAGVAICSDKSGKFSLNNTFGVQNAKHILEANGSVVKIDNNGTKYVVARYIKELKWFVVAKIDEDSIVAGLNKEFLRNEAIFSIFILLMAAFSVWQYNKSWMREYMAEERQKRQEELMMQQSKMAALGEMIDMVAHQWKQPLNALSISMQELGLLSDLGELDAKEAKITAVTNNAIINDMNATLDNFRGFFNPDKQKSIFFVKDAAQKMLDVLKTSLVRHEVKVEVKIDDKLTCYGISNELGQVLLSLVSNAKDILEARKISEKLIDIEARVQGEDILLTVTDNGDGVDEAFLEKIFEPRFTMKESGGTGVGLYMSRLIIEDSFRGKIWAQNGEHGAIFSILIPRS